MRRRNNSGEEPCVIEKEAGYTRDAWTKKKDGSIAPYVINDTLYKLSMEAVTGPRHRVCEWHIMYHRLHLEKHVSYSRSSGTRSLKHTRIDGRCNSYASKYTQFPLICANRLPCSVKKENVAIPFRETTRGFDLRTVNPSVASPSSRSRCIQIIKEQYEDTHHQRENRGRFVSR